MVLVCVCACVQLTGDMKADRGSSPPAKRNRPTERKVTFNPDVQERALQPANEPPEPVTLKEAADIVVRCLDPFYTRGKFANKVSAASAASRLQRRERRARRSLSSCFFLFFFSPQELFKSFARYLSHLLAERRSRGKVLGKRGGERSEAGAPPLDSSLTPLSCFQ